MRGEFPALHQSVYEDTPLVYLDNAATTQKPQGVLDRMARYYAHENSNVHRGVHKLSQDATDAFEEARQSVADLINAPSSDQVIFTRGCTESLNLVAQTFARPQLGPDDTVVVTHMEHHSNIVPWQMACEATGATLKVWPICDDGTLDMEAGHQLLAEEPFLLAMGHVSNALGTVHPVASIIDTAHDHGVPVVVDGAQSMAHLPVDVQALDADFYAFSGHKMFGPTGIGVLYGKYDLLDGLPPYHGGGDMIDEVSFDGTTYADLPHRLEAGTPHIAGVIGLGAAARFVRKLDHEAVHAHEEDVLQYAHAQLAAIDGLRLVGTAPEKTSVCSFVFDDIHPYDAGTILDRLGLAVRTGHHCTQPLMERLDLPGTIRASFALYNTRQDVDRLVEGLDRVQTMFG
jgi:cysteine desulfurase/selenocysteine lyase